MQTYFLITILFLLFEASNQQAEMESRALSSSIAKFAAKFVNELEKNKNVVSSPLSAEFVLALLTLGTSEPAHTELLNALGIPSDDAIRSSFTSVSSKLKSLKGVTLKVANKVYLKEGPYELVPELEQDAVKVFDAGFQKVNFANSAAAADLINKWVESKTNNKIQNLLTPDSFDENTRLVLVNALYFKGSWTKKFDPNLTRDLPFNVNANTKVDVPMMFREDNFKYGESEALQAQLLELSYEGDEASMLIVLPKEVDGLNDVLKKLADGHDLVQEMEQMFSVKVQVTIPKFKIETEINLLELLPKLGIKSIFNPQASGLDNILKNKEQLFVSKAVQKAFIEVNEEGAEAAAATGAVMMLRSAVPQPRPVFRADRPFLYLLVGSDRSILFTGLFRGETTTCTCHD